MARYRGGDAPDVLILIGAGLIAAAVTFGSAIDDGLEGVPSLDWSVIGVSVGLALVVVGAALSLHRRRASRMQHDAATPDRGAPASSPLRRAMDPWWAWIGVLSVTGSSLLARGLDVSDAASAAWTVFLLLGALLAVGRIALRFVAP